MKRSVLSVLGALCMTLLLSPITAKAAPVEQVTIAGKVLNSETPYFHNETCEANNIAEGANAVFDAATGTLTLYNLNVAIENTDIESGIYWEYNGYDSKYDLTIVLPEGTTNTISAKIGINGAWGADYGPSLTIQGSGTLNVNGTTHAMWVWEDVTIQDGAMVNLTSTNTEKLVFCTNAWGNANYSSSTITIKGNSTVSARGGKYGIGYDNENINEILLYDGTIIAEGGTGAFNNAPLNYGTNWTVEVGESEETKAAWDKTTPLTSYKYVKMIGVASDHTHTLDYQYSDEGHWQECTDAGCPAVDKGKTAIANHGFDNNEDAVCDTCGYTRTVTPGDTTAPAATGRTTIRTSDSTATVEFSSTEAGTYYYKCQHEGASPAPSASELKQYGTSASCVSGVNSISLTSLSAGKYEIFIAVEDAVGNLSHDDDVLTLPIYEYVASGTVEDVTDKTTNECNSFLDVYGSDLVSKVLSTADQQAVAGGKDVDVWLEVTAGDNKASDDEKTLTQSALGDYTLGVYLDVTLWKQLEGENAVALEKTNEAVTVTMTVPQSLINTDTSKTRAYEVIRIHDDGAGARADVLPCVYNPTTNILSFNTDKFSIYSLAYKDTVNNNDTDDDTTDDNDTNTSDDDRLDDVPDTGEKDNVSIWFFLALICGIGAFLFKPKERC